MICHPYSPVTVNPIQCLERLRYAGNKLNNKPPTCILIQVLVLQRRVVLILAWGQGQHLALLPLLHLPHARPTILPIKHVSLLVSHFNYNVPSPK